MLCPIDLPSLPPVKTRRRLFKAYKTCGPEHLTNSHV